MQQLLLLMGGSPSYTMPKPNKKRKKGIDFFDWQTIFRTKEQAPSYADLIRNPGINKLLSKAVKNDGKLDEDDNEKLRYILMNR